MVSIAFNLVAVTAAMTGTLYLAPNMAIENIAMDALKLRLVGWPLAYFQQATSGQCRLVVAVLLKAFDWPEGKLQSPFPFFHHSP